MKAKLWLKVTLHVYKLTLHKATDFHIKVQILLMCFGRFYFHFQLISNTRDKTQDHVVLKKILKTQTLQVLVIENILFRVWIIRENNSSDKTLSFSLIHTSRISNVSHFLKYLLALCYGIK